MTRLHRLLWLFVVAAPHWLVLTRPVRRRGTDGIRSERLFQPHEPARWPWANRSPRRRAWSRPARPRFTFFGAVRGDAGMTTAEYAVGTVAAVAFAVVLFKVVQSPAVHAALAAVVTGALRVRM